MWRGGKTRPVRRALEAGFEFEARVRPGRGVERAAWFRARERDPLKRWKLTGQDWRNLSRRADYEAALADMLSHTGHKRAPRTLIAAENKPYARSRWSRR